MRAPIRAAVVAPLLAAIVLSACTGGTDEDEPGGETTEEAAEESTVEPSVAATASDGPGLADPVDLPDGIAATVGDAEVADDEVTERVGLQGLADTAGVEDAARQVLSQLIQISLVRQAAEGELGLDLVAEIDGPAISAKKAELIESAGGPDAFAATATAQGITAEDADALAAFDAEVQVLVDVIGDQLLEDLPADAVDEDALRAAYEADPSTYQSSDVAHILLDTEPEAVDALDRIEDGEDFGDLARELSTGPSGPDGGELGVAPRGSYVEEFSAAVYGEDTEPGEVVGPVETQFGFHLIKVNEIVTLAFDAVLQQAREQEVQPRLQAFFQDSFAARPVVVDEQYGVWDPTTTSVVAAA